MNLVWRVGERNDLSLWTGSWEEADDRFCKEEFF
jgi:hypothetical protein